MRLFTFKNFTFLFFLVCSSCLIMVACQDGNKSTTKDNQPISAPLAPSNQPTVVNPPGDGSTAPAASNQQGQSGITHYICVNNCVGSGSSGAGTCPVCGTAYVHNDAYHTVDQDIQNMQQGQAQPSTPGNLPPSVFNTPQNQTTIRNQPSTPPAPAQNAAGVYHYTCANGCAGGAGSASPCPTCGNALVHNQAYHQ